MKLDDNVSPPPPPELCSKSLVQMSHDRMPQTWAKNVTYDAMDEENSGTDAEQQTQRRRIQFMHPHVTCTKHQ